MMVLKVDLQCYRCYKKVKKVLCRIPQIQDQVYNEKENLVVIKVVCCNPEKIKQKLICKGCGCIKSVEIKKEQPPPPPPKKKPTPPPTPTKPVEPPPPPPPKPTPPPSPKKPVEPPPPPPSKPVEPPPPPPSKPVEPPPPPPSKPVEPPPPPPLKPVLDIPVMPFFPLFGYGVCCGQCYGWGPCHCGCGGRGNPPEQPPPPPPQSQPQPQVPPTGWCCGPCSEGRGGGPCHYEGYGRPVYDSYGGGYYCQENPSGCTIM
uniref:HMA domain-containing protein n=1 Tax=Fagus sylvatica TaxID=28930 RepID=A0A2N9G4Z1_FAGSY